jgi:ABC-type multidrug transport system fused ATPase/permease subunit
VTKPSTTVQRFYANLSRLIRPYRWDLSIGLLATTAASGLAVLIPLTFRGGVDSVVQHRHSVPLLLNGLAVILLTIGKGGGEYLAYQRIAGAVMRFRKRLRPRYVAVQEQYGQVTTPLQENLAGIRLIQAYRQEQSETARFCEINQELFRRAMAAAWERAIYLPMIF